MMNKYFKKVMAIAAAAVLAFSLAACAGGSKPAGTDSKAAESTAAETESKTDESSKAESLPAEESVVPEGGAEMTGGWTIHTGDASIAMNPDLEEIFAKATEGVEGFTYDPAAIVATQVVAGTNYCFVARKCADTPEAKPTLILLYVYRDLSGNASILEEKELVGESMLGGFEVNGGDFSLDANEAVKNAFDKATETLLGVDYEPIAYLAKQIVNGTNYLVLTRTAVVSPEASPEFSLVTIYEDLEGNAKFGESEALVIGLN